MNTSNTESPISSKILYGFFFTIIILEIILMVSLFVDLHGFSRWGYSTIGVMLFILLSFISRKFTSSIKHMIYLGVTSLCILMPLAYLAYVFISYNNVIETKSQYLSNFNILKASTIVILILQTVAFYRYIKYINQATHKVIQNPLHWTVFLIACGITNTFLTYTLYLNLTHFLTDGYTNINL